MSEPIRFELTGKDGEAWNRVFGDLARVIMSGIMPLIPEEDDETKKTIERCVEDITRISGGFLKAHVERPTLENEEIIARTIDLFESAKLKRAQRQRQEIDNESAKLDLAVKRVETAVKLLQMLSNNFYLENGKLVLLFTNQNLAVMQADLKAISQQESEEQTEPTP